MKEFLKKHKYVLLVMAVFLVASVVWGSIDKDKNEDPPESTVDEVVAKDPYIAGRERFVHVKGAVKNPGLYELNGGVKVNDAINKAGGPTENADLDAINLAKTLNDGDEVYVPEIGESTAATATENSKININTASKDELTKLPGVGEAIAERIISYREKYGGFKEPSELINVRGIGENAINDILPHVVVR